MTQEPVPTIPLPVSYGAGEEPEPARGPGVVDLLLAGLVAALAFLLASTPARNSDLWLHLAAGRALVRGQAPPGTDPFASTTAGAVWVNHAWLSDVALYGLYELGDGRALVVAKALLVALLAGLFFCFRRPGARLGVIALAGAAAAVALGPWLPLQPALLSLLGVVLTLYLLERPSLVVDSRAGRARARRWLLVPLFALWANLDAWFLLGPALVGLYALGELLRRPLGGGPARRGELPALALLALAGSAACLLTPYHYHTFAWPAPLGLSQAERAWMHDPLGQGLVVSPFATWSRAAPALASPGGWAYCLLLAAGAASFALGGRARAAPGRLLAWLALAALSAYQARAIPFFAVAAGPVLALNLQESGLRKDKGQRTKDKGSFVLRPLSFVLGVALLVLAWPGWLQPAPYQPRGWAVEPDGSLVRLARELDRRHADYQSRPGHIALTFSPEIAHHLAWFCPSEKGFLDSRWPLFGRVAEDFVRMRRCLLRTDGRGPDPELGPLLDAHRIDRIILHDPSWERTTRAYQCLLLSEGWELLALEGGAALFGRRGGAESPPPWKPFDYRQAAYHPESDRRAPPDAPRQPEPPRWYDPFFRARDDRSPDRAEAALHLLYFDLIAQRTRAQLGTQWLLAQATGLLATAPGGGPAGTAGALAVRLDLVPLLPGESTTEEGGSRVAAIDPRSSILDLQSSMAAGFMASHDRGPPEALLLAVRAARRALATNPDDARAFQLLGAAYVRLARQTREEGWQALLPGLAAVRHAQALTALEQAVLRGPDLDEAHALLARLYYEDGQMDRSLDHLHARLRIAAQEVKQRGPGAAAAAERQAALQPEVEALEALVRRSQEIYAANTEGQTEPSKVFDRARLAARHGLSRKALEMLLASHPAIFGKSGAQMQLELMLQAGRAFEVRAWLEPDHEAVLGYSPYHWLQVQAAAACGDYAAADAELDKLSEEVRQVGVSQEQHVPVRSAVAQRVAGAVLARPVVEAGPAGLAGALFEQFEALRPLGDPAALLRKEADFHVLRGLLALESGAVEDARGHFRAALEVWGDSGQATTGAGLDFLARPIAQEMLRRLGE
jgi:tetratricopeptide (TPR) repeat protein